MNAPEKVENLFFLNIQLTKTDSIVVVFVTTQKERKKVNMASILNYFSIQVPAAVLNFHWDDSILRDVIEARKETEVQFLSNEFLSQLG